MKIIDDAQDYNHSSFDKLNEILNVAETAVIERERPEKVKPPVVDNELDTDYQYARENYYNVIERGHDALDELLMEAKENGNARMYEVVGQLITKVIKGLSSNPEDNSKEENEVRQEVIELCSKFPIYKHLG